MNKYLNVKTVMSGFPGQLILTLQESELLRMK